MLPAVKTVGVMGDDRTYAYPIVLRAVTSDDAMTADWARLPYDVLERISQPDHQRGARGEPGRVRHHVEAARHDRMGVGRTAWTMTSLNETARALVAPGKGILAADESSGTIKKRFDSIGCESTEDRRRAYREMLFTTEGAADYISGVILFDETIRQHGLRRPPARRRSSRTQGIIPGIKVDKGTTPLASRPASSSPTASTACAHGSSSTASSARSSRSGAR